MTSIDKPPHDQPAEGGDIPEAGTGAEHGSERPLVDETPAPPSPDPTAGGDGETPLIGNTPDEDAEGALRRGREQPDGLSD